MNTIAIPMQSKWRNNYGNHSNSKPFYRQHLEDFLGDDYSTETYNSVLDEVVEDVERRIKALIH